MANPNPQLANHLRQELANGQSLPRTMAPDNGQSNGDTGRQQMLDRAQEMLGQGPQRMAPDTNPLQQHSQVSVPGNAMPRDTYYEQNPPQRPTHDFYGQPLQPETPPGGFDGRYAASPQQQFPQSAPQQQQPYSAPQGSPLPQEPPAPTGAQPSSPLAGQRAFLERMQEMGADTSAFADDAQLFESMVDYQNQMANLAHWAQRGMDAESRKGSTQHEEKPQLTSPQPAPHEMQTPAGSDDFDPEWHYHVQFDQESNSYVPRGQYSNPEVAHKANAWRHKIETNSRRVLSDPEKWFKAQADEIINNTVPQLVEQRLQSVTQEQQRREMAQRQINARAHDLVVVDQFGNPRMDAWGNPMLTPAGRRASDAIRQMEAASGGKLDPAMIAQIVDLAAPRQQPNFMPQPQPQYQQPAMGYQPQASNQQLLEQHQQRAQQIAAAGYSPSMRGSEVPPQQEPLRNAKDWTQHVLSQMRGGLG